MTFLSMWSELVGTVPELPGFLAQTYIQRAWKDVCRTRSWSFKQEDVYLNSPDAVDTGTMSVTQFSEEITADATAKAALNAVENATPPLVGRQYRKNFRGAIYTIVDYDNATGVITLDQPYQDETDPTSAYVVYKCLYEPPTDSFQRFVSIRDPNNGYAFTQLHVPKAQLDRMDPTRSSQQLPFWLADYDSTGTGRNTRWEMWPHPTTAQTFICTVQIAATPLSSPNDELPPTIPESVVTQYALSRFVVPWLIANMGRFPRLKGVNVAALKTTWEQAYADSLAEVKKDDDGRMLKSRIIRRQGFRRYPLDANFIQNHDVRRIG